MGLSVRQTAQRTVTKSDIWRRACGVGAALTKGDRRALPHTREKLEKHVASLVKGKGVDELVPKLVKRLFKDGFVKEAGKELSYPTLTGTS